MVSWRGGGDEVGVGLRLRPAAVVAAESADVLRFM